MLERSRSLIRCVQRDSWIIVHSTTLKNSGLVKKSPRFRLVEEQHHHSFISLGYFSFNSNDTIMVSYVGFSWSFGSVSQKTKAIRIQIIHCIGRGIFWDVMGWTDTGVSGRQWGGRLWLPPIKGSLTRGVCSQSISPLRHALGLQITTERQNNSRRRHKAETGEQRDR